MSYYTDSSVVDRTPVANLSNSRTMVESTFSVEAMVRGYQISKNIWTAVVELICQIEPFNSADPCTVAVV